MITRNAYPTERSGKRLRLGAILAAVLAFAACDLDITNTNAPTVEELTDAPTREVLARAATGIFAQTYNNVATEIQFYALYGREGYNLLGNDPREVGEQIRGPQDPTGRNSGIWVGIYAAIRSINTYLAAVPEAAGLSDAERRAAAGMARTFKAWHLHRLAVRTGAYGIPVDVDRPIDADPAPFVSFANAMQEAADLMDEAYDDLQAGSAAFPFTVPPGYGGFDTPATFALFNRALAAKIQVHRATFAGCAPCWSDAATALGQSFVTDAGLPATLATGVYYAYSASAGEPSNPITEPLSSNRFWVHASIVTGAQLQAGGQPDQRLTDKVLDTGRSWELENLTGTHKPVLYNNPADPATADLSASIPWITNEELLLLRAEVRWNDGDRPGAIADIDRIRQNAGGLPPTTLTAAGPDADFVDELLYNRLYSLMWSQGTRWIDARRYDRLDQLPIDRAGDSVYDQMLVPADECAARSLEAPCQPL
jgi:starch-binding outer membrane protein, SusD/RagB family